MAVREVSYEPVSDEFRYLTGKLLGKHGQLAQPKPDLKWQKTLNSGIRSGNCRLREREKRLGYPGSIFKKAEIDDLSF
mgnify:CR=1 FL=1